MIGLILKNIIMTDNSQKAIYIHGSTDEEQERLSLLNQILNKNSLAALNLNGHEKILDVGSGLGQFSQAMARTINSDGSVLGIERDKRQLNRARHLLAKGDLSNLQFRQGDAYDLPLSEDEWGSYDLVHSRFLLEHLAQPEKAIQQMVKAARVGGIIMLSDDDHSTFRPSPEPLGFSTIWTAYCRSYERLGNDPYIGRRLVTLLYQSGINIVQNGSIFFGGCKGDEKFDLVSKNLIGILEGAKEIVLQERLLDKSSFERAIKSLYFWKDLPDAALFYSIDWVKGMKV